MEENGDYMRMQPTLSDAKCRSKWTRAKLTIENICNYGKNKTRFGAYIVVFAVKKNIIHGNSWQERKDTFPLQLICDNKKK